MVVGFGMAAGPIVASLIDNPATQLEIVDRGVLDPSWPPEKYDEKLVSRSPGLSVPLRDDWIEFRGDAPPVTRVRKWWSASRVGGGAWLWYGQLSRFQASDFDMPPLLRPVDGHMATTWPVRHAEMLPHYQAVEAVLRPYGCSYGIGPAAYAAVDCSHVVERPGPSHFERTVIDRLSAQGLHPYIGQTALGGRAWDVRPVSPLTPAVPEERHPLEIRRTWLGLLRDRLVDAPHVKVTVRTTVIRVLTEAGEVRGVEAIEHRDGGQQEVVRIRCGTVILAGGALDTARILLTSELPNRNAMLGRGLTFTQERVAYLLTDIDRQIDDVDLRSGMFANVVLKDFYEPSEPDAPVKCGKFSLYDGYAAELPYRHIRNVGLVGRPLARFLAAERSRYAVKVSFKGESIPWDRKYVRLGSSRNRQGLIVPIAHYQPHPYDAVIQDYAASVIGRLARALHSTTTIVREPPAGTDLVSAHHHGGAVFGTNRRTAVLDENCECFEARGLFVADASVMPTSGATNSTLTAMALAHRLAGHLKGRLTG